MKQLLIVICLSLLSASINGQNNTSADDEYSKFAKTYNADLNNFRDQYNAEFSGFVKQYWTDFEVFKAKSQFSKPKPKFPTVVNDPPAINDNEELKVIIKTKTAPQTNAALEFIPESEINKSSDVQLYNINFCGEKVSIRVPNKMVIGLKDISEATVGDSWDKMSKSDYLTTVYDCQTAISKLALNDWGYFLLLKQIANALFKGKPNENNVFMLFLLNQTGYDARIGKINDNELSLLLPFVQDIYEMAYMESDGKTYYVLAKGKNIKSISTYKKSFISAKRSFDMGVASPFNFVADDNSLKICNYGPALLGTDIDIEYNTNDITVYKAYPLCSLNVYCNAPVSKNTEESLRKVFEPAMKDLCQLEKVNLILEFIQAMPYKTDIEQFGYEKYFFPEEVFSYPYCDCEDRSALFKWIITNIVGLEVINLEYDDHVSAAVKFTENVNGDFVLYDNSKYVICDPTYIGAPAGLSMPQYKNIAARIIN